MSRIAIVDYGLGNLFSVERAFGAAGATATITTDATALAGFDGIVVPGVGAFGVGIQNLEGSGLANELRDLAKRGMPTLGICLGMQLLMDGSEELGDWQGLGLLPGKVIRLGANDADGAKVPQIGWNTIAPPVVGGARPWKGTFLDGIDAGEAAYFVHSYCVIAAEPTDVLAESEYAGTRFCSVIARGNVMGCQFHPEKSGGAGLRLIRNFLDLVAATGGRA